jgi:hypothetical protein
VKLATMPLNVQRAGKAMSTILESPQNPSRTCAGDPFGSRISLHLAGYALVISLILARLAFGPSNMLAGKAEVGCAPAPEHADQTRVITLETSCLPRRLSRNAP